LKAIKAIVFLILLCLHWGVSSVVLWWAYDFSALVNGGAYYQRQALGLVAQMGLIITGMTTVIWLIAARQQGTRPDWQRGWRVAWQTAIFLATYALAILIRRQLWKPNQGINDWAMFFGYLNGRFFSEAGGLSFLTIVVPIMGTVSGILYTLRILAFRSSNANR
jgi:hypothetical protein